MNTKKIIKTDNEKIDNPKNRFAVLKRLIQKLNEYSNLIIAVATVIGFYFIWQQLDQFISQNQALQTQNTLMRETLLQSYRPIGVIQFDSTLIDSVDRLGPLQIHPYKAKDRTLFSYLYSPKMINKGTGLLINIGHIFYMSEDLISLKKNLLNGKIEISKIKFDYRFEFNRRETILPGEFVQTKILFDTMSYLPQMNFYILAFYEDKDGNLYDTEHRLHFEAKVPNEFSIGENYFYHVDEIKSYAINIFGALTKKEKNRIVKILKTLNHPMANHFSN